MAANAQAVVGSKPPIAGPQPRSLEDTAKAIDNSPLFMKKLPPAGEMDDYLATQMDALQSLLYEGDAEGAWRRLYFHDQVAKKANAAMHTTQNRRRISRSKAMITSRARDTRKLLLSIHKVSEIWRLNFAKKRRERFGVIELCATLSWVGCHYAKRRSYLFADSIFQATTAPA